MFDIVRLVFSSVLIFILFAIFVIAIVLPSAIRITQEYERGVVFRLGRFAGVRGPGLILLIPFVERMIKVDLRTITMDVPPQEVITKDNVPARVNAVVYFRLVDPELGVLKVENFVRATSQIAQTTLRSVLGQSELDEMLSQREAINHRLQQIIDEQTNPWGIKVSVVELKDVEIPQEMQRAIAKQAEAERLRRAKVIIADGEFQASEKLRQAAEVMAQNPLTIQLRFLQTIADISPERNTTTILPIPINLLSQIFNPGYLHSVEKENK
ncbi:slipin family protein [Thermodesulfobium sp. 4217-1]|uniref:slipin family protein n=1 Tax=Thermodesulfobium sp. 4217-1 TaxID=3120013 RepID=UPI0032213D28